MVLNQIKAGWIGASIAGVMLAGMSSGANAALMLEISSGTDTAIVTDGGLGDLSAAVGQVRFSGAIGGFSINISTGTSKPIIGNADFGSLDLSSIDVSGPAAGTLTIRLTDTDFLQPNITSGGLAIAGITGGTVAAKAYIDFSNAAFGQGVEIADLGPFVDGPLPGSSSFSDTEFSSIVTSDNTPPFSLTIVASIMHTGAGQLSSFDAALDVFSTPSDDISAPGTLAVLGFGLLWFGTRKRRSQR